MSLSSVATVDVMKVCNGTSILMLSIAVTTMLTMALPQIALWLPATLR